MNLLGVVLVLASSLWVTVHLTEVNNFTPVATNRTLLRTTFLPKSSAGRNASPQQCLNVTSKRDGNFTYTMKNGKLYKVYRVKKVAAGGTHCDNKTNTQPKMQRRTMNTILGNLTNMLPLKWVTKSKEVADSEPSPTAWKFFGGTKRKTERKPTFNSTADKLKRLLNLFTIVKFDNGGCVQDGLKGTCYHQLECQAKGGRSIGSCAKGYGVCCYIERTCGQRTSENCTYFVNEGFPQPSNIAPRVCALTVDKASPHVKQLRVDFQTFELKGPSNGTCLEDRFLIMGQNSNDLVPDICGINTGQHVYVDVDDTNGPLNLNVILMGDMGQNFPRTFRMKITQVMKDDVLAAPKNCLQYYTEPLGTVHSFNYQYGSGANPTQARPGYFNNMNYAICVKKGKGFCSITYSSGETANGEERFQLVNVDQDGESLLPPRQAGAEVFNCPDDYISVNGVRLCGERLNDASVEVDYSKNAPVTDYSNGPFILPVKTNEAVTGRGFYLSYKQNPCLG